MIDDLDIQYPPRRWKEYLEPVSACKFPTPISPPYHHFFWFIAVSRAQQLLSVV